jgi:hypothetical protein
VSEDEGSAFVKVWLVDSKKNPITFDEDIVVDYRTADMSALSGQDYVAQSGSITIPAGTNQVFIEIPIIDDLNVEGIEFFRVEVTSV